MLFVHHDKCLECGGCVSLCPVEALFLSFNQLIIDETLCTACGICLNFCPVGAIDENHAQAI